MTAVVIDVDVPPRTDWLALDAQRRRKTAADRPDTPADPRPEEDAR